MAISEFSFSVDDFNNPKIYKNAEAISVILTRLLLLEPGTIQSHPDCGVGLYSRFRYGVEDITSELQSDFSRQIERYLPQFQGVVVSVTEENRIILINVTINNTLYSIFYDTDTAKLDSRYVELSELQQ